MTNKSTRRHRTIEARLMPWFEGAVTLVSLVIALLIFFAVVAAIGFYLVAAAVVIPVCMLVMRMGGWKIDWKAWRKK